MRARPPMGARTSHAHERLGRNFYRRNVRDVAADLLGAVLVRRKRNGRTLRARILETEAYGGRGDRASHAYRGRTARNYVMFGPPGYAYVYFTYGMHWLLNVVAEPAGSPAAVLIRVVELLAQRNRRRATGARRAVFRGPARATKRLSITGRLNGEDLVTSPRLWIARPAGAPAGARRVIRTPRIGVAYAGSAARWRRRFVLEPDLRKRPPARTKKQGVR